MKIDTTIWNNKERLRIRLRNLATTVMSLAAVNALYTFNQKQWLIFGINILFFVTTVPVFISWGKFTKNPPEEYNE